MQNIDKILSLEIKRELANRYFGFRKLIEEDIHTYDQKILGCFRLLEQKIGFHLIRLYTLLKDKSLIHDFFSLSGFAEDIFFDPYLLESQTIRKRLFKGLTLRGLSKEKRFRNLFFDLYSELNDTVDEYRTVLEKLALEQATIQEEINLFYRKNDLGIIMDFLRNLEGGGSQMELLHHGVQAQRKSRLEKSMQISAPEPVEAMLPLFTELKPLKLIKKPLRTLLRQAYANQGQPNIEEYTH